MVTLFTVLSTSRVRPPFFDVCFELYFRDRDGPLPVAPGFYGQRRFTSKKLRRTFIQKSRRSCGGFRQKCKVSAESGNPGVWFYRDRNGNPVGPNRKSETQVIPA